MFITCCFMHRSRGHVAYSTAVFCGCQTGSAMRCMHYGCSLKDWVYVRLHVGRGVVVPCGPMRITPRVLLVKPNMGTRLKNVVCMAKSTTSTTDNKEEKVKKQNQKQKQKNKGRSEEAITPQHEDYSRWYLDIVAKAELADYGPVRGTMVIRPYGFALWEGLQKHLDQKFKETGHENAYFPQLIPLSFINKEASHVEGFAPELAIVTKGGGKELEEPLAVRPTSETMVNHMFAHWIHSYRDLPLLLNQWVNVHRWEMRTRPFIRTLEFLWQEGHTAHATAEEAREEALRMLDVYVNCARNLLAMPVVPGRKSNIESFAGANVTFTIEAMMGDMKALQAGTSHDLGTNFAEAFGTQYTDANQEKSYVHQTSWGVSTRLIGGLIMCHGDDQGLRLPPQIAPIQVVILPIERGAVDEIQEVKSAAGRAEEVLTAAGLRVKIDLSDKSLGWKINHWEMKGVPVRIELGPRDLKNQTCVTARRDRPGKEGKNMAVPLEPQALVSHIEATLDAVQGSLLEQATAFRDKNTVDVTTYDELKSVIEEGKWARGPWKGSDDDERMIKEECQATLRCFPFQQPETVGNCFLTGQPAEEVAIFAKAY